MGKRKKIEPLAEAIERALDLGQFVSYNQSWDFVRDLEEVKGKIDALVEHGQAQYAVGLYEIFFSGCHEKAEEIDDSGGNLGMFAQDLFISWIKARQKAKCSPAETVKYILRWMDNDDYGFCFEIEKDVAQTLNKEGFLLFRKHFQDQFDTAFAPFKDQAPKYIYDYPSDIYRAANALKEIYIAKKDVKFYLVLCEKVVASPKDCENIATLYRAKGRFADALEWAEKGLTVVDAYDEAERAMGWFYYLEDKLQFPFKAQVIAKRLTSPLKKGEPLQVEGMAPGDECEHEMFVEVTWKGRKLAVPLSQLKPIKVDNETREAIEDWHYWVSQGYEF